MIFHPESDKFNLIFSLFHFLLFSLLQLFLDERQPLLKVLVQLAAHAPAKAIRSAAHANLKIGVDKVRFIVIPMPIVFICHPRANNNIMDRSNTYKIYATSHFIILSLVFETAPHATNPTSVNHPIEKVQ